MIRKLLDRLRQSDSASESGSESDGFLSYAAEWHAFTHGVYKGVVTKPWAHPPEPNRKDVKKESHYYRGGYVIGTILQVLMLAVLALVGHSVTL